MAKRNNTPTDAELINKRPLKDDIFDVLHDKIVSGKYKPGEWLRQEDIATSLGVSMTPVREALDRPWVLDMDASIKPLYGRQEGAEIGYNPAKPMRPSHVLHTFWVGNLRLVLDAVLANGARTAGPGEFTQPGRTLGVQLLATHFDEYRMLTAAYALERALAPSALAAEGAR